MATRTSKTQQIAVRLPHEMLQKLDEYAVRLQATMPPGFTISRADAARALIAQGLEDKSIPEKKSKKQ